MFTWVLRLPRVPKCRDSPTERILAPISAKLAKVSQGLGLGGVGLVVRSLHW
jgi:hypothetical protein